MKAMLKSLGWKSGTPLLSGMVLGLLVGIMLAQFLMFMGWWWK